MLRRIFTARNILIAVSALLVSALIAGLVVVTLPRKVEAQGVIESDKAVPVGRVNYSPETEGRFKADVSSFFEAIAESALNILLSPDDPIDLKITNSAAISDVVLDIFAGAAISSEKLLKVGAYLKEVDSKDAAERFILFFLEFDEPTDGSNTVYATFASPEKIFKSLFTEIDYVYTVNAIVAATALTQEECARIAFEAVYRFSDDDRRGVLEHIGRSRFVSIATSIATIYDSYLTFDTKGGTPAAARTAAGLAYQVGAELEEIIESEGMDAVLKAIGLDADFDNSRFDEFFNGAGADISSMPDTAQMNDVLSAGSRLAEFMLYALSKAFTATDSTLFESLSKEYEATDKAEAARYEYLHRARLAYALSEGIEAGYESSPIKDSHALAAAVTDVRLCMEALQSEMTEEERDTRRATMEAGTKELIDRTIAIGKRYGNVSSYKDIENNFTDEDYAVFADYIAFSDNYYRDNFVKYDEEGNEIIVVYGGDSFVGALLVNRMFNIFADILNQAVGKDIIP